MALRQRSANTTLEEVLSDEYIETFIKKGALYIWYYVTRPGGRGRPFSLLFE